MRPDLDERLRRARHGLDLAKREEARRAAEHYLSDHRKRARRTGAVAAGALLVALAVALGAVAAVGVSGRVAAPAAASRLVDRTLVCTPERSYLSPQLRLFDVVLSREMVVAPWDPYTRPASAGVGTGRPGPAYNLVLVRTRQHPRWQAGFGPGGPGVYLNMRRCTVSSRSIPLSASGLPTPAIRYDRSFECETQGRILVRVRATLAAPASLVRVNPTYVGAVRNVTEASIAIRAQATGRPLAFARVAGGATSVRILDRCF